MPGCKMSLPRRQTSPTPHFIQVRDKSVPAWRESVLFRVQPTRNCEELDEINGSGCANEIKTEMVNLWTCFMRP